LDHRLTDLNRVHTSNNVEATGNKVASCFDIVVGVDWALQVNVDVNMVLV